MIRQILNIEKYGWEVHCYYAVDTYFTDEITDELSRIGADGAFLQRAIRNMDSRELNHGLCYSNMVTGESVLVISLTSSAAEFVNSFKHEVHHLVTHICEARGIDIKSEEAAYLAGDIAMMMFPKVVNLICDHCRRRYIHTISSELV